MKFSHCGGAIVNETEKEEAEAAPRTQGQEAFQEAKAEKEGSGCGNYLWFEFWAAFFFTESLFLLRREVLRLRA